MRVPLPISIASCVLVTVLAWWLSTRSQDFLTPPSKAELAQTRLAARQTNPTAHGGGDALSPQIVQSKDNIPIPVIMPRHVNRSPELDDYLSEARFGTDYLIELAQLLDKEHPERALICWERVIDSSNASESQLKMASQAVCRLKKALPTQNTQASEAIPVLIQAGTGPSAAKLLAPVLEEVCTMLGTHSSGTLFAEPKVSVGDEDMIDHGKSPVALWISAPLENSRSSDVVSFFISLEKPENLKRQVQREVYRIVQHHLNQMNDFQPLPKPTDRNSPEKLLEIRVTRMLWLKFAESLHYSP